ncbi:transposase [Symbiopectobacterium sp. RP]|uniref:transposase n=1 Tax=Symbiopectobacterium sp. RP TaxID=3248553 RepID=UPI003D2BF1FD
MCWLIRGKEGHRAEWGGDTRKIGEIADDLPFIANGQVGWKGKKANINSDVFYSWVTQVLIPVLPKNRVIVMDNATFHKKHNIQQVIIDAGYMVEYLPTYSPDLNPIEHKWAQARSKKRESACDTEILFSVHMV